MCSDTFSTIFPASRLPISLYCTPYLKYEITHRFADDSSTFSFYLLHPSPLFLSRSCGISETVSHRVGNLLQSPSAKNHINLPSASSSLSMSNFSGNRKTISWSTASEMWGDRQNIQGFKMDSLAENKTFPTKKWRITAGIILLLMEVQARLS